MTPSAHPTFPAPTLDTIPSDVTPESALAVMGSIFTHALTVNAPPGKLRELSLAATTTESVPLKDSASLQPATQLVLVSVAVVVVPASPCGVEVVVVPLPSSKWNVITGGTPPSSVFWNPHATAGPPSSASPTASA